MSQEFKSQQYATEYHVPIMVDEVLELLAVKPGGVYVDGTLGGGGHTHAILDASGPNGRVIGIDRDADARESASARLQAYGERLTVVAGNYGDIESILSKLGVDKVDGILVDAGISSHQVDTASRGFSFSKPGPLDMRMGGEGPTVAEWLDETDESSLAYTLRKYGEVKSSRRMARAILESRDAGTLHTTSDLAEICELIGSVPHRRNRIHPATLVFQALRIVVNNELGTLEDVLAAIPNVMDEGGRAVFMSFHSLEDRIVKQALRGLASSDLPPGLPVTEDQRKGQVKILTRKPTMASEEEIQFNPRSRSAKLRAAQVI